VAPRITKAAAGAGRPAPRIVAGVPVVLCGNDEVDAARAWANQALGHAEYSPNYERLLERGDAGDVGDLCAAGGEAAVVERLRSFRDAGATDLAVRVLPLGPTRDARIDSRRRTEAFLASLCPEL
jgi:alkanesulfonate monooxygenase SsuD/methylene tetrahydromethanopterin reductase-like flavin-dependent oxidoreductase (luciferase family)